MVTMLIRTLNGTDIADLMALKEAAGWNQSVNDWARLLALEPAGCFGVELDGRVVASTTAVCYGRELAWIGMVLTLPEYRGRGLARALMEAALGWLSDRGVGWAKLDATAMGEPLYSKLGFETECGIERWFRQPGAMAIGDWSPGVWTGAPVFDADIFGAHREPLLGALASNEAAVAGDRCAYGMLRPGAGGSYFGPCVAEALPDARRLAGWFLARHAHEVVCWDLLPGNEAAVELAAEFGFEPVRRLKRMRKCLRGGAQKVEVRADRVFAIAGFEFG